MNIEFRTGDIFKQDVDAIVNTVNCVGVMGKGLALQFKKRIDGVFQFYKDYCDNGKLKPGNVLVYKTNDLLDIKPKYIFNFSTKDHWRSKSKISYISEGLDSLIKEVEKYNIKSIAIPALGCGNGELDWEEVKPIIINKLEKIDNVKFIVLNPSEEKLKPEHKDKPNLEMTKLRAILIKTFSELQENFGGKITHLCMQKTVYFLQVKGYDYGIKYTKSNYGPYSDELKKNFEILSKFGYLDGFHSKEKAITISQASHAIAEEFLNERYNISLINRNIHSLELLFEGFESPLGMELLTSVHFCFDKYGLRTKDEIIECVRKWSERKKDIFGEKYITDTIDRLTEDKLIKI